MKTATKTKTEKLPGLLEPGSVVLIRTAIYHALGRVERIVSVGGVAFLELRDASYIGDTGRYHLATAQPLSQVPNSEIEPVGLGGVLLVQVGAICDVARAAQVERSVR